MTKKETIISVKNWLNLLPIAW